MKYFDNIIVHQIKSIFYSNYEADKAMKEMESLISVIEDKISNIGPVHSKRSANEYFDEISEIISDSMKSYENHMNEVASSVSERESLWYSDLVLSSLAINLVLPDVIIENTKLIPYSSSNTIKTFTKSIIQKLNNTVRNSLNTSVFWGYGGEQLVENISKPLDSIKKSIGVETQEMVQSFVKNTQHQIQKENKKLFTGYKWCAILDSKVCDVCAELNGTVYKDLSNVPFSPIHYKCRCNVISFVQELSEPEWDSFGDWIETIPEEDQLEILGKTRFDLWKSGELEVNDFVNDGRKILLSDLYDDWVE